MYTYIPSFLSLPPTPQGHHKAPSWARCDIQQLTNNIYFTYAAAAKSLQSCPTLCNPIDCSPLGSSVPGILQARILEWVAISFSKAWKWKVKVKSLSRAQLLATPWTAAHQALPSMGFSRQEYWSGVACIYVNATPDLSHPSPPALCPHVHYLCLHLYFYFANRFICIIFLDSIYMRCFCVLWSEHLPWN